MSHANVTSHKQRVSAANPLTFFFKANEQTAPKGTPSVPPVKHQLAMTQKRTMMHSHLPNPKSTLLMMQVMCMMLKFDGA